MDIRRLLTFLLLSLTLILSSSCSPSPAAGPATSAAPPKSAPVTAATESSDDAVAKLVDSPVTPPEIQSLSLGTITFDLDETATASADFLPGSETVLELTDASGLTWKLTVPMNALTTPQTLSMTALANLRSQDVPGSLSGGLRLEPDGLVFLAPAVLSVSGNGVAGQPFLLAGQGDGSGIEMAYMEQTPGVASISHFSTFFSSRVDEEKTMDEMAKKLDEGEKALTRQARELLKDNTISVPIPPSVPLECTSEAQSKAFSEAIDSFAKAVFQPEGDLIGKLLAIKRGKQLLGKEIDPDFILENRLLTRVVKKVRLLISTYRNQEEKLEAVAAVALQVSKSVELLKTQKDANDKVLFLEEIGSWAASLIDGLLEDIRVEHDYRKISAVWKMAYWANLTGSRVQSVEEIQAKMERILRFDMKLKWEMGIEEETNYIVEGGFPMRYTAGQMSMGTLTGSGKAEMVSFKALNDEGWFIESAPFHVKAIITGFDPCGAKAYLTLNRFYPDKETHFSRYSDGEVREIGEMPLMKIAWETLYEGRKKVGLSWYAAGEVNDQYTFQLNLRNKDVNAVSDMDETIDAAPGGTLSGWFSVDLLHTPK